MKIRGAGNLSRQSLAILRELYAWRETEAQAENKPRGHVVKDGSLLAVAKKKITNSEDLHDKGEFSTRAQKRYGAQFT